MPVAQFDYDAWSAGYPALASKVTEVQGGAYFNQAGLYLNNSEGSPEQDVTKRTSLLYLLVAHIATLNLPEDQGGSGLVGRVASASRGSVSVSTDMGTQPGSAAWFMQTQYGASFWQATIYLRQARYVRGRYVRQPIWP